MTEAPRILQLLLKLLILFRHGGRILAALALGGIVLIYSYEVVARYLFNAPTAWSAEVVTYLLCVLVFCMMPTVTATKGQVAVTVLLDHLKSNRRRVAEKIIWIVGCVICALMAWFASTETFRQYSFDIQMMAVEPIPKWWISIWIGFGFALSSAEFFNLALTREQDTSSFVEY